MRHSRNLYDLIILELYLDDPNVPNEFSDVPGMYFLQKYRELSPLSRVIIWTKRPSFDTAVSALSGGGSAPAVAYLDKESYPAQVIHKPASSAAIVDAVTAVLTNVRVDDLRIDLRQMQAYYTDNSGDERPFDLTGRLFAILKVFMLNPDTWLTYQDIARILDDAELDRRTAHNRYKSQVWRLRDKLKELTGREVITYHKPRQGFALLRKVE